MKHFTSVFDVTDINTLIANALRYKANPLADNALGLNKRLGLMFMNPSMRTRISTQIAARNLGMDVIVFNIDKDGWKLELDDEAIMNGTAVEHIKDAAPVLGQYFDVLGIRTFPLLQNKEDDYSELLLTQLLKHAGLPIVSLESSTLHPLQSLADMITIKEEHKSERKPKIVLTWAPHIKPIPQCVVNSFAQWVNKLDNVDFVITHPTGFELNEAYTAGAVIEHNQQKALQDADFVYIKNWSSVAEYGKVLTGAEDWMLTTEHLQLTNNAKVMHCLPVRRNVELSAEVLDSPVSLVTQQASNRVWAAQAVLAEILKNK